MLFKKDESIGLLTGGRPRLLWHCCWCFARRYTSPISVHNLPILGTLNVDKSNERKCLYGKKKKKAKSRRYPAQTITDTNFADDIALLSNTPNQAESLLHSLGQATGGIDLHVNADKTEYMWFNQEGDISSLKVGSLKLMDKFTYLGRRVSFTKSDINICLAKAWTAIDRLSNILKSDLSDDRKRNFFRVAAVSILLNGCTTWVLTKCIKKMFDGNCTRMLRAILNKSWKKHSTKQH